MGRPTEALGCLDRLAAEHQGEDDLGRALLWRKAAAKLAAGDTDSALPAFGKAAALAFRTGRPVDVGYALLEFSQQLLETGKSERLLALAGEALLHFGKRSTHRRLAALLEDFYALSRLRPVTAGDLKKLGKRLNKIDQPPRSAGSRRGKRTDLRPNQVGGSPRRREGRPSRVLLNGRLSAPRRYETLNLIFGQIVGACCSSHLRRRATPN